MHATGLKSAFSSATLILALLALSQNANSEDARGICRNCAAPYAKIALAPPANFDPRAASDIQLDAYGFPPRPDQRKAPAAYAQWETVVTHSFTRIVPQLQATTIVNGPVKGMVHGTPSATGRITGSKSGNWSGYVISNSADPFRAAKTYIFGTFTVPVAQQAFGECASSPVDSSEWVGIDGSGSSDVLQAGIRADATCRSGRTTSTYAVWYEWFPHDEVDIKNFDIHPGDLIYVYVWNTSATEGHFFLGDVTTGKSASLAFAAPSGVSLKGNSAEWIVERPSINGKDATLTNYVYQAWLACHVLLANGTVYSPAQTNGGTSESLTMTDGSKNISYADTSPNDAMAYTPPTGSSSYWVGTALWFFDEGPALKK